jgi:hypothetical protein
MNPELYAMMLQWLESGNDGQKVHAARRLNMPDAIGYKPGLSPPKLPPIPDNPTPVPGIRLGGCCGG